MISTFINKNKLSTDFQKIAEGYFIPLAEKIRMHQLSAKKTARKKTPPKAFGPSRHAHAATRGQ